MNKDYIEIFTDSYARCTGNPEFLEKFYELFISSSDEVKEKFKDTDMDDQKLMLQASLSYIVLASRDPSALRYLDNVAESHSSRQYKIPSYLYDLWLKSMIRAVKLFDPEFDTEIEKAWILIMQKGIDYLKSKY